MPAPQGPVTLLSKVAGLIILLLGLPWIAYGGYGVVWSTTSGSSLKDISLIIGSVLIAIGIVELLGGIGILRGAEWGRGIGILYSVSLGLVSLAWTIANISGPATLAPTSVPPTAATRRSGVFAVAGMAPQLDVTGAPSSYVTSFVTTTCYPCLGGFYVSYKLAPGLAGKVSTVTTSPDGKTTADSYDYPGSPDWGYFGISRESFGYTDGFAFGDYKAVLTFEPTGESITLPFTITEPTPAPMATVAKHFLSTLLFGLTFVLFFTYSAIVLIFRWRRPATG